MEIKKLNVVTGKFFYGTNLLYSNVAGEVKVTVEEFISDLLEHTYFHGPVIAPATCDLMEVD